jgi:Lon protease-like protein
MGAQFGYRKPSDLPAVIPVFPLNGAVVFPRGQLPLNIFEPRYLNMVDDALAGTRLIGMVQTAAGGDRAAPALCAVGCVGRLTSFSETDDGRYLITLTGIARFRLGRELQVKSPYRQVEALWDDFAGDLAGPDAPVGFDRERLSRVLRDYLGRRGLSADWDSISSADPEPLVNGLAAMCPFSTAERQGLLEAESLEDRARMLTTLLEIAAAGDAGEDGDAPLQ